MKQGYTISEVILYTNDGRSHKVGLTKSAKSQLIRKIGLGIGLENVSGSLTILDSDDKEVKSFPYNNLLPILREL